MFNIIKLRIYFVPTVYNDASLVNFILKSLKLELSILIRVIYFYVLKGNSLNYFINFNKYQFIILQ